MSETPARGKRDFASRREAEDVVSDLFGEIKRLISRSAGKEQIAEKMYEYAFTLHRVSESGVAGRVDPDGMTRDELNNLKNSVEDGGPIEEMLFRLRDALDLVGVDGSKARKKLAAQAQELMRSDSGVRCVTGDTSSEIQGAIEFAVDDERVTHGGDVEIDEITVSELAACVMLSDG